MRRGAVAWGVVVALAAASGALIARPSRDHVECGAGFIPRGPRCVPADGCPSPLVFAAGKCVAPQIRVAIPRTRLIVGPSDWEAEGKVRPRTVEAGPFWIDAFEATQESFAGHDVADPARAAALVEAGRARYEADFAEAPVLTRWRQFLATVEKT